MQVSAKPGATVITPVNYFAVGLRSSDPVETDQSPTSILELDGHRVVMSRPRYRTGALRSSLHVVCQSSLNCSALHLLLTHYNLHIYMYILVCIASSLNTKNLASFKQEGNLLACLLTSLLLGLYKRQNTPEVPYQILRPLAAFRPHITVPIKKRLLTDWYNPK